jgi:Tfp pilus assembly protein PilZ
MSDEGLEKRICVRFRIPGATVAFKKEKALLRKNPKYSEEFLPVLDLSRGGIRFLSLEEIPLDSRVHLRIQIPGDQNQILIDGTVRWLAPNTGTSYKHQIGVQFSPYGEKKGMNYPGTLVKIIALEQKYLDESNPPSENPDDRGTSFTI